MIPTSREYQERIRKNRVFYVRVDMELADGTVLRVRHDEEVSDIMQGGFKIADGTSGNGSFDIGAAVIGQFTLRLNNADEQYSRYDFTGAVLRPKIGLKLSDTVEWMNKGVFEIDEATALDNTVNITALDHMEKFDRPYSGSTLHYPATLGEIVRDACTKCGVVLATQTFDRKDYVVEKRPEAEATFRDVLSWAAQIAGCYCRCNADGRLELRWYDLSAFGDAGQGLDGGHFDRLDSSRYQSGDTADGGRFRPWDAGDAYDAGGFGTMGGYHHIYALTGKDVCADDVVVTGVRVAADEGSEYQAGSDGYVLSIEKNLLIAAGKEKEAAEYLAGKLAGLRFRPLSVKAVSDPSAEAGDIAIVSDRKGNQYRTILTNLEFSLGDAETYTCDAQTPSRRQAVRYSESTKAIVAARKETAEQIGSYDLAVQDMVSLMANSMGLFKTAETTENGGHIIYLHNKPALKDSAVIWKMSEQGFMVSRDKGKTWVAGMDASGNAVLNLLSVIGINFDWAQGGTLTLGGKNNGNGSFRLLSDDGKTIATMDNTGFQVLLGVIAGPTFISSGIGYIGQTLNQLYTKIEDGRYWLGYNEYRSGINDGKYNANIANFGNGMRFIAPLEQETATITEMSPKFAFFFDPERNSNVAYSVFSIRPSGHSVSSVVHGKDYATAVLKGNLVLDPFTAINDSGAAALGDSAGYGIGWLKNAGSHRSSNVRHGIYPVITHKGYSNAEVSGIGVEGPLKCETVTAHALSVSGSKSRIVATEDYGTIHQYCYEMAVPYFGDIGGGITDSTGECCISIDDKFSETCSGPAYYVFLQKESEGELWVERKEPGYFIVKGTPGCRFAWELKQKQRGYENHRLDKLDSHLEEEAQPMDIEAVYGDDILPMEEFYEQQYA